MTTYWKANRDMSRKIRACLDNQGVSLKAAKKLCKKFGGSSVYICRSFGTESYTGFAFRNESKVDKKLFVRLKGTTDGWRPRARTDLAKKLGNLRTDYIAEIMKHIGMKMLNGITVRSPGVQIVGDVAYLAVPSDVTPAGCTRISDMEYEKCTSMRV